MRGEGIGKPELGREHCAEITRSENPQRYFCSRRRHRLDALIWTGWSQESLHLENVLREVFGRFRRSAQGAQCKLIGPWCTAKPEVNAAGKQPRQRPKLLGDDVGSMV